MSERRLSEVAREAKKLWGDKVNFAAKPYLDALCCLDSVDDMYGADSGKNCVLYFLSNASGWRGEDARRIKTELKKMAGVK